MRNRLLTCMFGIVQFFFVLSMEAQEAEPAGSPEKTIQLLYETKPLRYVNGAVSHISGDEVSNAPGLNRLNVLAGRLPGLVLYNIDGLPGYENSTFRLRGNHTFSSNRSPVILIDGKVDDYTSLDPYDIESIVLLKDAASAGMYGLRSLNGVVLVNTKKGEEGRIKVSFNTELSSSRPTRMPKYLDAYQYALLYNEAQLNDDPDATPKYDATALEAYRTGSDPYRYPNVDWTDEFIRKNYLLTRYNLNVSGGNNTARYYVSANYLHNSGVFNVDKEINTYNTNTGLDVMNVHGNVRLNIGRYLKVNTDIRAKKEKRNAPGGYSATYANTLITSMFATPFNAHPILNRDGSIAGTADYQNNPYGILNYSGYSVWERSSISSYVDASYDLGRFIRGLSIEGRAGFNTYTDYYTNRTKSFAKYQMNTDGNSYTQIGLDSELGNSGAYSQIYRNFDHNIGLRYAGTFEQHAVDASFLFDRQQVTNAQAANLASNFQGPKGSLSYRFNDTYLADFSFAWQGSEQYPKNRRYGFFPAAALGWIVSNEAFLQQADFIDFLKVRASHGLAGNHVSTYFEYLEAFTSAGSNYFLGVNPAGQTGYYQSKVSNPALTWEEARQTNAGLDFTVWNNRLSFSVDYFMEKNKNILIQNAITGMYGASVYMPAGKFENRGYELQAGWTDQIRDFSYSVKANYAFTRNKIVYQDEIYREYPWMYRTGKAYETKFGYVFDRFFTEEDNIASLPDQSMLGGTRQPGDLKYKDLNNDGVINDNDITDIGNSKMPEGNYGISLGAQYKGIDLNILFHGAHGGTSYLSNNTYWAFHNRTGNVMEHHLDRWTPGSGQSAEYPRLSLSNSNNTAYSSYWMKDYSFLRLKYVEIGYTLPLSISQKAGMTKARIFVNGQNLLCWDGEGVIDPELQDGGIAFPIQQTFSVGLNLVF